MTAHTVLIWATVSGFITVVLGAFGAHGLAAVLGERIATWQTAVHYQMFHTGALLVLGLLMLQPGLSATLLKTSGYAFLVGILLFSGSLYVLSLTGISRLGMITPLGGVAFLIAWLTLGLALVRGGQLNG